MFAHRASDRKFYSEISGHKSICQRTRQHSNDFFAIPSALVHAGFSAIVFSSPREGSFISGEAE
jgi:hypothetical protein